VTAPAQDADPSDEAGSELAGIREQTRMARAVLRNVEADIADAQRRLGGVHGAPLVAVNQQLMLALLRSQALAEEEARSQADELASERSAMAEREHFHSQLQQANQQLVLAGLDARELQAAAERALRRQTDLLAVVAHELRNPLAPIRNAAAVLGRIPTKEPVLGRMQSIIERQVEQLTRMVGDLLDLSRVNTGKLRLECKIIDLAEVIATAIDSVRPSMERRSQRFDFELDAGLRLHGDPVRLTQVFNNLLDNASKYTASRGEIRLCAVVAGDTVVLTVSDTGIGITPQALPHIFEPFMQDAHATIVDGAGLGIGLTVVRELVEAHGGTVAARSPGAGLGSEFVVNLPLGDPKPS
jgi:signal transduction histidine kinase